MRADVFRLRIRSIVNMRATFHRLAGRGILLAAAAAGLVAGEPARADKAAPAVADQKDPEPLKIFGRVFPVAKSLRSPDGIACDAESGNVYVSEENSATIVCVRRNGSKQALFDASTPLYEKTGGVTKKVAGLRSPEGLALDGKGTLYVVEDIPGGRLISFPVGDKAPSSPRGTVIPIPIENSRFAWESVDVGPGGELLVAGSTMESYLGEGGKEGLFGLFRGAILYRDAGGEWWMPLNHAMASYSAVCFSSDGKLAFYACEISGDVGCLDLRTHNVRTCRLGKTFHAPEGLCALPGGSALVVEEAGKIFWLDPTTDSAQLVYDNSSTLESVRWDGTNRRLLATDDQQGHLLSLELKAGLGFRSAAGSIQDIPYEEHSTSVEMVPERCPDYLAKVLKLGGYDSERGGEAFAFRKFARKYCLIAIDADTELLSGHMPVEDPIQHIQFMIVAPYLIGFQEGELIWSSSGFTVVKASGQSVKTGLVKRQIIHGDLLESRFTPIGGQTIALPMPFSARVNVDGLVSVNFMGMGVTPDFYLVLDTADPDKSVMVVIQPDGFVQQYEVHLPPRRDRDHWVVALERKEPDAWKKLSAPGK